LGKKINSLNYKMKKEIKRKETFTFGIFSIAPPRRLGADPPCVKLPGRF